MSTEAHGPARSVALESEAARIGRPPAAAHMQTAASAANHALLDICPKQIFLSDLQTDGVYSCGYTPSTHARWLWIEWVSPPTSIKGPASAIWSNSVDLTIRDTSGGSWSATVPPGFNAEATFSAQDDGASRFTREVRRSGWIDLDTVRGALTGTDWTLELTLDVDTGGAYVSRIQAWECPRFIADNSVTTVGGVVSGSFAPHAPILAGPTSGAPQGIERVLETVGAARTVGRTYLSLAWPEDIAAAIPQTTSAAQQYLTNLESTDDTNTVYVTWTIRVRRLYAAAVAGESIRWRVRYRFATGTTETATVYLHTGATGTPWSVTLSYTETWTWSAWQTTAMVPTNSSGTLAVLGLEAKVSAGGGEVFYLAALQVEESPA